VWTVVLDRPSVRNAVDRSTAAALASAFREFDAAPEASVAVLWGAGGTFCAGADLHALDNLLDPDLSADAPMGPSRLTLSKPVIAAVEGYAVAGGLELALLCDLRIASETAVFGVFCRRWGVPLIDGGTVRLPRLIGQSRALDMILTGRPVDAEEALAFGLANRVVVAGQACKQAVALAQQIAAFPQACVTSDRRSLFEQWSLPMPEALRNEARLGDASLESDGRAGAARFVEGRKSEPRA